MRKGRASGFTLIELMIVVTIIIIMSCIAIPSLLRSRIGANEVSAMGTLRTVREAQVAFFTSEGHYATEWDPLIDAIPPYLSQPERGILNGYTFELGGTPENYEATASAMAYGYTGTRGFFVDGSGVVRCEIGGDAHSDSPPLST